MRGLNDRPRLGMPDPRADFDLLFADRFAHGGDSLRQAIASCRKLRHCIADHGDALIARTNLASKSLEESRIDESGGPHFREVFLSIRPGIA